MIDGIFRGLDQLRRIPTGFLLAISIVLGLVLFLPDKIADTLAVKEFRNAYRSFLGPGFLLSAAFTITKIIMGIGRYFGGLRGLRLRKRQLHDLTPEEKGYLYEFIINRKNTIYVAPSDGTAGGLLAKSIIYQASTTINILEGIPFNLQPWARKYLTEHRCLLKGAVGRPLTTQERVFGPRLTH